MRNYLLAVGVMVGYKILTAIILIASGTTYGVCFRTILVALVTIIFGYAMDYLALKKFFRPETFSKYEGAIEEQMFGDD